MQTSSFPFSVAIGQVLLFESEHRSQPLFTKEQIIVFSNPKRSSHFSTTAKLEYVVVAIP